MAIAAIEAEELTRVYGSLRAVDGVSFTVEPGEIFGFLGPNGAGKTTTVRMLTTILTPTDGTARIFGHDIRRDSYGARLQFGVVPEESNVYLELSAWQNLLFSARLYRIPSHEARLRAERLLQLFGLWGRHQEKVQVFSRGMRRKVAIAMSLIHEPGLLFLDEPTSGLDVQSTRAIHELIRHLNQQGTTVFLTTHRMEEAQSLCTRIAIINRGRLATVDTPTKLRRTLQQLQAVEVQIDGLTKAEEEALQALPTVVRALRRGSALRLYTPEPVETIRELLRYADEHGKKIAALETLQPSLEEVFLYLTEGIEGVTVGEQAVPQAAKLGSERGGKR
jgi:ABC-2 type transport system ATP-binding protein